MSRLFSIFFSAILFLLNSLAAAPPQRVVSLSPNLTQTIFALGAGDRVVGVSDFCVDPAQVRNLPRVGGWTNPNYEVMTALNPDLIVVLGEHEKVVNFAASRNIRVARIPMDSLATIRSGTLELGRILGCEDQATSFTASLDAALGRLSDRLKQQPNRLRPRVYLSITRKPGSLADLFTVNGDSFVDEALRLAGGENIFHEIQQRYPQVSKESIVERQPDMIFEIEPRVDLTAEQRQQLADDWRDLKSIPAVRNNKIDVLQNEYLLIAGPEFPKIVEALHKALYPSPE